MKKQINSEYNEVRKVYTDHFVSILRNSEQLHKLNRIMRDNGKVVSTLPLSDLMDVVISDIDGYTERSLVSLSKKNSLITVDLCYLNHRLNYFRTPIFKFTFYNNLSVVVSTLTDFMSVNNLRKDSKIKLNGLLTVMDNASRRNPKVANTLSFRYLRLFVILVLYEDYMNASIIATLLLSQIKLEMEVNNEHK